MGAPKLWETVPSQSPSLRLGVKSPLLVASSAPWADQVTLPASLSSPAKRPDPKPSAPWRLMKHPEQFLAQHWLQQVGLGCPVWTRR